MSRAFILLAFLYVASAPAAYGEQGDACEKAAAIGKSLNSAEVLRLADELTASKITKDEFETTEAYKARLAVPLAAFRNRLVELVGAPLIIGMAEPERQPTYHADRGLLTYLVFSSYARSRAISYLPEQKIVVLSSSAETVRTYEASNAFGAKTQVRVEKEQLVGIMLPRGDTALGLGFGKPAIKIDVKAAPADAREIQERGTILFAAEPMAPFVERGRKVSEATFKAPIELETNYVAIVGRPVCAVIYDPPSKRILRVLLAAKQQQIAPAPKKKGNSAPLPMELSKPIPPK